ncbi:MAG: riboflavin kinase/FMN adenylyltransferase [Myxococcaceae bacterium]|nr:riboflavin kinase/FMN adenylyltransferase [Myxococcaceae bacterium]
MRPVEANTTTHSVVTPGNYDGVHLGHRALVATARRVADESTPALRVVALTFDPHPLHFIAPERAPALLTDVPRRIELLRSAGADEVMVQSFDRDFSLLSPLEFVEQILVEKLAARAIVVGTDFRFGAQRAGDVALLKTLGAPLGIRVTTVPPVTLDGEQVSSSHVRAALIQGEVERAARMLTRVHDLERKVMHGFERGRTIGFPTANLELAGLLAPADGVYAVSVRVLDGEPSFSAQRYGGVANLGVRPTVQGGRSMEVHLLDFAGDLYGRTLRIGFVARLRGETKFPDLPALRAQIARDVEAGRRALESCDPSLLTWI